MTSKNTTTSSHPRIRKAIFPVGGLGTRFLPATKAIPKEMLPVASKPLIQHAFEEAVEAGIEEFVFVTGRNKSAINNHFDHAFELQSALTRDQKHDVLKKVAHWTPEPGHIAFIPQSEPKGLGHAVWCARHFIGNEPFAVILADEMVLHKPRGLLGQMIDEYNKTGGNIIAAGEVERSLTSSYGVLDVKEKTGGLMPIANMVEKPKPEEAPSCWTITGRYILQPSIFDYLANTGKGAGGEIQLTDAMQAMQTNEGGFYGLPFKGDRFDCGSLIGYLDANISYSLEQEDIAHDVKKLLKRYQVSL